MEARSLLAADAAFWMAFEGAAEDLIGSNEGALQGNVQFVNGHTGTAAKFSGNESINILKNTGALDFGGSNFTIETWVNADGVQSGGSSFLVFNYGGGLSYYAMTISTDGRLRFDCRDSAGSAVSAFDDAADSVNLLDSSWHHVAASRDGSTFSIYVDGVLRKSTTQSIGAIQTTSSYVRISGANTGPGNSTSPFTNEPQTNFRGLMDELTIYPRALTPLEIARAYNPPVLPVLAFDSPVSLADSGASYGVGNGDFNQDGIVDIASANYGTGSLNIFLGQGNGNYGNRVVYPVGGSPSSVAIGDIDGDGKLDLATGTYSGHTLVVLFGNGDGTFGDLRSWSNSFDPVDVKIADMNNDGRNDLVAGNYWNPGGSVTVLLGAPGRSFQSPADYTASNGTESVALSDFDGDGDIDVATADYHAGTMSVMLNNGNGTLAAPVAYASGALAVWIDSADFNRDGYVDLVVSNYAGANVSVFIGNGNGTFRPAARYALGSVANVVRLGDLNGDGLVDLAVSLSTVNRVGILPGVGDGTFSSLSTFVTGSGPNSLTIADFDGNGTKDIATANYSGASISILKNLAVPANPYLSISTPTTSTLETPFTVTVTALDANGQTATNFNGTIRFKSSDQFAQLPADYTFTASDQGVKTFAVMFQSAGNQTLSATLIGSDGSVAGKVISVAAPLVGDILFNSTSTLNLASGNAAVGEPADFNGDGFLDLATVNEAANTISITLGLGNGTFGIGVTYATGQGPARSASADLNGDGKLDLLVANYTGGNLSLLFGLGNGSFLPAQSINSLPGVYDVGIGDFNHDGILDIAADSLSQNGVFILIGNGAGNYLPPIFYSTANGSHHVTVADVDGDGALDLLTANYFDSNIVVLYGNKSSGAPDGTFGNRQVMAAGLNTFDLIAEDLNGDGKLDIATTNRGDGTSTIYRGLGARQFLQMPSLSVGPQPYHLVAADFNGDGRSDLAFASLTSHQVTLFAGNGNVTFQPKGSLGLTYAYRLAAGDFNSDGNVDLVASTAGNGVLQTWLGVGAITASAGGPYSVAAGTALFLDGTNSSIATNLPLTYQWDLDYDGLAFQPHAAGRTALFDASQLVGGQQRTVALRVTDSSGFSDTSTTTISIVGLNSELDGGELATEELVNTTTSRDQMYPALAMNKNGNSVVAYESGSNGTLDLDILAQRYNAIGAKVGGEAQVNLGAFDERVRPGVAMADDGRYVVAWQGWAADQQGWGVNAQRFDKDGNRVGSQFIVNVGWESGYQVEVDLAISPDGSKFVVLWEDTQNDGSGQGVFASLFDWNGGLLNTVLVNNYTSGAQDSADVEMLATGDFVVTWASQYQDGSGYGIFARRFNASGNPIDPTDIQINRFTTGDQTQPDLATRNGQEYIITWQTATSNRATDIVAQRFDSNFNRIGAEFIVNESSAGDQYSPAVAFASNGFVTFTWSSPGQDGSGFGIFARTMGPGTNQMGHEFQINSVSVGDQNTRGSRQSLAYTPTGETVVTWWGNGPGDNVGVFQRRFVTHNHVVSPITDENTSPNQIAENAVTGSDVGIRTLALDPELYDTVTYSLDDSAGNRFAIDPTTGVITVAGAIDRETAASYDVVVRAQSTDTSFTTKAFTIAVVDVDEFDTSSIIDTNTIANTVPENSPNGTLVNITAFASDADATNNGIAYSLDDSAGGRFGIDPVTGVVQVAGEIDRETAASYDIVVRAQSEDTSFTTKAFTITVVDVDEFDTSPIIDANSTANTVLENAPNGTLVNATAFAADDDATNNGITYSLDDSAGGRFAIDPATGIVHVAGAIDRETAASYDIVVRAQSTDTSFTTKVFTIAVVDVDEFDASSIIDANTIANTVPENSPNGTSVNITAFASDADATNNDITYSLDDSAGGRFAIDPATGVVQVAGAIDYETSASHTIVVRATSADGSVSTASFLISVVDVNEGIVFTGTAGNDTLKFWAGPSAGQFYFKRNAEANLLFTPNGSVTINGGGGNDTLIIEGTNLTNQFDIYADRVRYNSVDFYGNQIATRQINALGSGDTINAYGGTASVNGGSAVDTLIALTPGNQVWSLTAPNAGNLNGQIFFTSVESLIGSDGDDQFLVGPSGSVSGRIDGGIGLNTLDYTDVTTALNFNLQTGAATKTGGTSNIARIIGGSAIDTLTATNVANQWTIGVGGSGTINGSFNFNGVENLVGGSLSDVFTIENTSLVMGNLSGGGGVDSIEYQSNENLFVNLASSTASKISGTISSIEQITLGAGTDTLVGRNVTSTWNTTGANAVTTSGVAFQNVETLVAGSGADTLIGTALSNQWNLDGANAGRLDGLAWSGIENLTGGTGNDAFLIAGSASVSGIINGGNGFDVLDYRTFDANVTIDLSIASSTAVGKFTSISTIFGSATSDRIIGADNANTWSFTASGGVVDGLAFESFENWQGGAGIDSLSGPNTASVWSVTGANSGDVANVSFASMENLIGNSQLDTFEFQANGSVSGQINGGLGEDVLDFSASAAAIVVNLSNSSTNAVGSFSSISAIIGSAASDTLQGANSTNTWTIATATTFTLNSLSVRNFESLVGGTGVDVFRAKEGVEFLGSIDGGTGVDRMEYTTFASSVSVNLSLGSATGFASVSNIENITGGNGDDLLVGDASDNVISGGNGDDVLFGMAGNDTLNGNIGRDLLFGGSGADLIRGSNGEDILIGGLTNHAQESSGFINRTAIDAIMLEWRRTDSTYAQRIARLNGLALGGFNGSYVLDASTLDDDQELDELWGDAGLDWFWVGLGDIVHFTAGEDVENL